MDYEKKYKEAVNKIKNLLDDGEKNGFTIVTYKTDLESIFPELKESEDELTWLKKYIEEEAYSLSIDIRDNEDHIKLKNLRKALAWLEKVITPNHNDIDSSFIEDIKNVINEAPLLMQSDKEKMIAWLEKQGECHISHDDEIMIEQLTEYFTTGRGLQNTNETVVEWLNDVKEKLEKQGEAESDNDDIEAEEKGIREAFNKIEDEKQCKQKPFDYKNQGTQNSHKFNIGDIISNGNVEFRIDNIVKNCVGQDCYFLVDVESEKNGTRYLTMGVRGKTSHMGETTWLCEQVDKSFKKQGEQKPITEMKSAEESLGISSETYNEIVNDYIFGENKPKFKVDEWIVYYRNDSSREIMQIYDIRDGRYYFTDNVHFSWSVKECDEKSHLWTIQDAKDGDVIFDINHKNILLFRGILDGWVNVYCSVHEDDSCCINFNNKYGKYNTNFSPATKEQRDFLFKKMKEAGYEWDADKKELKKFHIIDEGKAEMDYCFTKMMNGEKVSSAWGKEDEEIMSGLLSFLLINTSDQWAKYGKWILSLKERMRR